MMKKIFALATLILTFNKGYSQKAEEILAKFPGEEMAVLNSSQHYHISLKNGQPAVESNDVQQLIYLTANAPAYLSRYGFAQSSFHQITSFNAYTKTADGKKIKVTNFKTSDNRSSSVFYDDVKETNFDFPGLGLGAVGTLEMETVHKDPKLLSPFYFTRRIPVVYSELKISFPKSISIKYIIKGLDKEKVQFTEETRRGETTYSFKVQNLEAEKSYGDAPDNAYYATHVIFYIESYEGESGEKLPYLGTTDDLNRLNYSHVKEINKTVTPEIKSIVDSLTKGISNQEQKARAIYRWVQEHIKYVAFENGMEGFIPREAALVCNRRFGDCKDMSSILTVMLNYAQVPAYYTWIGTRSIPYDYTDVALPIVDNHMICTIKLNDKYIFLDGTDPSCIFGIPSEHIQGKQAFIGIDEKNYKIERVPVVPKTINTVADTTHLSFTEQGLKGKVSMDLTGYYSIDMHSTLNYVTEKDREDFFKKLFNRGSNKFKLEKYDYPDLSSREKVHFNGEFLLQDYAKKISSDIFLNLNLFKFYEHQEIDYPKRKTPIEFSYLSTRKYVTILDIPDGYKVSYLPKSKTYKNDVWGFSIQYEQKNNQVIMTQIFENDHMMLQPDKFQAWNKVLEELFPLYKETINLSKK